MSALTAGVLYLVGMLAGLLSVAPAVDAPDHLARTAADARRIHVAAGAQLAMGAAYAGAAVALYALVREHGPLPALGFLLFGLLGGILAVPGAALLLALLGLSRRYQSATPAEAVRMASVGRSLRRARDLTNHVATILALGAAGALLYGLMLEAGLGPGWLAVWGLAGVAAAVVAACLVLAGASEVRSGAYLALTLPLAAQQVALAVWLIAEGLSPAAGAALTMR